MVNALVRYQQTIAWVFTGIFYLQLIATPIAAKAAMSDRIGYAHSGGRPVGTPKGLKKQWKTSFPQPLAQKAAITLPATPLVQNVSQAAIFHPVAQGAALSPQVLSPDSAAATTTTGPTQPEMLSFQSVNANNMVDLFTGDFSYNIPLLDVGGYPVNLHYQSGITMDQDASWVGLGWNINPGTISRNMRGLPDDYEGDPVAKTISIKPNKTYGFTMGGDMELVGFKMPKAFKDSFLKFSASQGFFYNTYKGWGHEIGINPSISVGNASKGAFTANLGLTNNSQTGFDVSPSMGFQLVKKEHEKEGSITIGTNYNSRVGIQDLQLTAQARWQWKVSKMLSLGITQSTTAHITFAKPSYTPTISIPYTSSNTAYKLRIGDEKWALANAFFGRGYFSKQEVLNEDKTRILPAYGYLNYDKAGGNPEALLDFNREKDVSFSNETPHIAVPIYTYDTYSISGEGTGGMFRPYRGDIGYVYDHAMKTKSSSFAPSLDLGFASVLHVGIDVDVMDAHTGSGPWKQDNYLTEVIGFRSADSTFENVYFKNPGEKTAINRSFLDAIGDDKLVRVDLTPQDVEHPAYVQASRNISLFKGTELTGKRTLSANTLRKERDKRTQVISYLNATEAGLVGLDRKIRSYNINSFPATSCKSNYDTIERIDRRSPDPKVQSRRAHHLGEITVLNADGRRYVYGIPVYNTYQAEVTMATGGGDLNTGLVNYTAGFHNDKKNTEGQDGYFNKEEMYGYSHSFLLSGILSDNYVDLTGDGISEDDNGEAVKFNYSRIYGNTRGASIYNWRVPVAKETAFYNEGLKTDSRDQKGSYTYGTREVWYLNSVESKTMIATFVLDTETKRQDGFGVGNENGGVDSTRPLYRLKQINLYTKADFLKNGQEKARPIKTVNFEYSYELCKNDASSINNQGKLTLKKVWFTYNKNYRAPKNRNPYIFTYSNKNPDYSSKASDRWGNYKDVAKNPGIGTPISNADYSYTLQRSDNYSKEDAAANVAAWTLTEVKLPSGGKIKVSYESDEYAYVQNKRAMQFFSIAGFGRDSTGTVYTDLYQKNEDYHYVYVKVTEPVANKNDITARYLEGVTKLYVKMAVNMPGDHWGKGYEFIPCYADIEDYGVKPGTGNKMIWIKVSSISKNQSPFATAAIQFLRLNAPSKAYPYSEPGDNVDFRTVFGVITSVWRNLLDAANGFDEMARTRKDCRTIVADRTFARLNNPTFNKFGGGLRVKRVEVSDNWADMTSGAQKEATYGQDYDYSMSQVVNGDTLRVSSGVASFEPGVGGDENPFHVPLSIYTQKVGALAPSNFLYTEEPFAETFFPAPMVGYSQVRVQTIHKTKKSANGVAQTNFYTTKDFPVFVEYTPLDKESKKTWNPKFRNFFKFDAHNNVTLSQGFKVELNDMNGKVHTQAYYAQDSATPISYSEYFYRLENDKATIKKLSNKVSVVDSLNGKVNREGEIGKDVEIMVDVREQISVTKSRSIEANMDFAHPFPPILIPSGFPLPVSETNQYRSVAITKVVNRYGVLDSVLVMDKGSRVVTRNMLYDAETGEVVVTQTNNEFDDSVFNFTYPAHWAYSGMAGAYKNISATYSSLVVKMGKVFYGNGKDTFPMHRHFEPGDQLLVSAQTVRSNYTNDTCNSDFYNFPPSVVSSVTLWAVNAAKATEKHRGIYLIDASGRPFTGFIQTAKVIRSGRRNMMSAPVGSITSLKNPVRVVNDTSRIVLDTLSGVIAAGAARFKDVWKVDSSLFRKDTMVRLQVKAVFDSIDLPLIESIMISYKGRKEKKKVFTMYTKERHMEAMSRDANKGDDENRKTWIRFNFDELKKGSRIMDAVLRLPAPEQGTPQLNDRNDGNNPNATNRATIVRTTGRWIADVVNVAANKQDAMREYFEERNSGSTESSTRVYIPETPRREPSYRPDVIPVTDMVNNMHTNYYNSGRSTVPAMMMRLYDPLGATNKDAPMSRMVYKSGYGPDERLCSNVTASKNARSSVALCEMPTLNIKFYHPCSDGTSPVYATSPTPGYYCYSEPVSSYVCRPNIDSVFNPYVWGVWGNWKLDRSYVYYDNRKQSDTTTIDRPRTDGEIKDFTSFWSFTNSYLQSVPDTNKWVWNSEISLVNSKGYEVENHDPLDRYNAGQYGYNRTMPVSVTQNSRQSEAAFEGFEDYDYKTDTCITCAIPRFINLTTGGTRVDTVRHTGKYSLRIAGNQTGTTVIPVKAINADALPPAVSMRIDSTPIVKTKVTPQGKGLKIDYTRIARVIKEMSCNTPALGVKQTLPYLVSVSSYLDKPYPQTCQSENYKVELTGKIQPLYTETYTFYTTSHHWFKLWINGVRITENSLVEGNHNYSEIFTNKSITLTAGVLYDIKVEYTHLFGDSYYYVWWSSASQSKSLVPTECLYRVNDDTTGSVVRDTTWCVKPRVVKPSNVTLSPYRPVQGKKVLVSAWVKEESLCTGGAYVQNSLVLQFNNGVTTPFTCKPKGPVIDGWQRIEDTLTIPASATSVTVSLKALSGTPVYFDDIRIQPYQANMKAFVYNPVNIRLMAELDENNYATFYEYDDEGTLIRVKKETERGIKTIKETRSALYKD